MLVHIKKELGALLPLRLSILWQYLRLSIKMNITVDKYPLTITVKMLHERFFY